jgi:PAS domain S-box-containing protein
MAALREETGWEALFWLVFDRSSNPVVLLDDERRIMHANSAAVELFGGDGEQLIGSSMADSIKPSERPAAAEEWQAFLASGEYSGVRDLIRPDGSEVEVEFAARMADVGGRRLAIYVAMITGAGHEGGAPPTVELPLTMREREVVTLIALGRETDQIAQEMHVSPETVRTHVRNAMGKLGAHTRAQLVAIVLCAEQALHPDRTEA